MKAHSEAIGADALPSAAANPEIESYYRWDEPDTNLAVLLNPETVDRLQIAALANVDPRAKSGDEIGGILLGWTEPRNGRTLIVVEEFEPVFCEHRKGPSYSLDGEDTALFEAAITWGRSRPGRCPVGCCRSHLRHGLFLSPDDLALISRFFPDPDNVFLLIKPLPNSACTAGFFFWKEGRIQADFTGSEVPLIPVAAPPSGAAKQPTALAASTAPPAGIPGPPATPAPWTNRRLRRIAVYGFTSVAIAATAAILILRPSRPAAGFAAPKASPVAERALTKSLSAPEQAVSIPQRTPKPDTQTEASQFVPVPRPTTESISAAGKPFVAPSPEALPVPAEPPSLGSEPPVAAPAAVVPTVPLSAPVVESPAPPPPPVRAMNTTTINLPAVSHTLVAPRVIHQVTPAVPRGVGPIVSEVEVDVEVRIDNKGKVTDARVRSTRGAAAELLTIEALKAAQLFRFQPAEENGRAVPAVTILTFRFSPVTK